MQYPSLTTTPPWIRQILKRSDQHVHQLRLECPKVSLHLYKEFLDKTHTPYSVDLAYSSHLLIPFPADESGDSFEQMGNKFMAQFETYLIETYGSVSPLGDN